MKKGRLVKEWKNLNDLQVVVLKALSAAFNDNPQIGWIRGNTVASEDLITKNTTLLENNAILLAENVHLKDVKANEQVNLADICSPTIVKYTIRKRNTQLNRYDFSSKELETNWHDFFLIFAPHLSTPKTDVVFEVSIKEYRGLSGTYLISQHQKAVLKAQYAALGLIKTRVSKTTQGNMAEFIDLTANGIDYLQRSLVITNSGDNSNI